MGLLWRLLSTVLVLLALPWAAALGGPFGIDEGMPTTGFEPLPSPRWTYTFKPERTHSAFEFYAVAATPKQGVCGVTAIGHLVKNDRFGERVKEEFAAVRKQLIETYGKPANDHDILKNGAIYKEARDWVGAIRYNERIYESIWTAVKQPLKDKISEIWLRVNATSSDESNLVLRYNFSNIEACRKEMSDLERGAL